MASAQFPAPVPRGEMVGRAAPVACAHCSSAPSPSDPGLEAAFEAVHWGTPEEVRSSVSPQHLSWRDSRGCSLLFFAVARRAGSPQSVVQVCRLLVELSCDIDHEAGEASLNQTPLFYAASYGLPEVAAFLLDGRADISRKDMNIQTPLFWAAHRGNFPALELLLARRADPCQRDLNGETALFYAAKPHEGVSSSVQTECIGALLSAGRRLAGIRNKLALHTAFFNAVQYGPVEACSLLLEHRCGVDDIDILGQSALFYAAKARPDSVDFLLSRRAMANLSDKEGQTPLFLAASHHQVEACRLLLTLGGADPHAAAKGSMSPARRVLQSQDKSAPPPPELIALFREHEGSNMALRRGRASAASSLTTSSPRKRCVRPVAAPSRQGVASLDSGDDCASTVGSAVSGVSAATSGPGGVCSSPVGTHPAPARTSRAPPPPKPVTQSTHAMHNSTIALAGAPQAQAAALFDAAAAGHSQVCSYLIERRCDVDCANSDGCTPLFAAAKSGADAVVRQLTAARACANHADKGGRTALFYAIREARARTAALLLDECGARPPCEGDPRMLDDGRGNHDLAEMARDRGFPEVVQRLRAAAERRRLDAALLRAVVQSGELTSLIARGADVHAVGPDGRGALHLAAARRDGQALALCQQLLRVHGVSAGTTDGLLETPLFGAAAKGLEGCIVLLVQCLCDPQHTNRAGRTALFGAAENGRADNVATLVRLGALAGHRDAAGRTALFGATQPGCAEALSRLVDAGAGADVIDTEGRTPLFCAQDGECSRLLIKHGCDPDVKDRAGQTALDIAIGAQRAAVAKVLMQHADPDQQMAPGRWSRISRRRLEPRRAAS